MNNRSFHAGIKMSPYGALFGCHAKLDLDELSLPDAVLKTLRTGEDLERVVRTSEEPGSGTPTADGSASPTADPTLSETGSPATESVPSVLPSCVSHPCISCSWDVAPLKTSRCALR